MENSAGLTETYGPYLEELRRRLYRIALVFVAAFVAGLFSTNILLPFFVQFLAIRDVTIVATSPFQLLELTMNAGFFCALIVSIPFALHQIFGFLKNGLLPRERRLFFMLIPLSALLFSIGFAYGFSVMFYAIKMIAQVNVGFGITNLWDISQFISQMLITSTLLGLLFEFPIVLSVLIRLNAVSVDFLRKNRRIAIATILIFVALLPPTDGLSFLVMSVPLLAIYELTILANSFYKRKELLSA